MTYEEAAAWAYTADSLSDEELIRDIKTFINKASHVGEAISLSENLTLAILKQYPNEPENPLIQRILGIIKANYNDQN